MKNKYVIKGTIQKEEVYFIEFENHFMWGSNWNVRKCTKDIREATHYTNEQIATNHCLRLGNNFKIYPVCPNCGMDYSEPPAISRKDNKTKICPNCGLKEALTDFIEKNTKE